jgi:hypothetical protein
LPPGSRHSDNPVYGSTFNTSTTLDIRLAVGSVGEQISVVADAVMVNTQSGTLSQVVQQQYIQELPLNGRNAASLIRMVPGVVTGCRNHDGRLCEFQ